MFKKPTYIKISDHQNKIPGAVQEKSIQESSEAPAIPQGVWSKCPYCGETLYVDDLVQNKYVCYKCGKYLRVSADQRIEMIIDEYTFQEWDTGIKHTNPLQFEGYMEKIQQLQQKTGLDEAVITGMGRIHGEKAVIAVCDARFMMGSMGYIVGEKITRAIETATKKLLPVIIFTCSGGARMQEGMVSLMQMAKTSQAIKRHSDAGLLYISVLTDPTTGGVTASFAMLGDLILGEPGALVGFAGPRVIEQTIGQKLPEGFQTSEFLVEHGIIDGVIERQNMKETLFRLIRLHKQNRKFRPVSKKGDLLEEQKDSGKGRLDAWERVQIARRLERPTASDYIQLLFKDFIELHGERNFKEDGAIIGGIASFHGLPVTVIGQQKGKNTKENIVRNFGMPQPEGYRKALRLMKQAEKFNRPIICFVDTPGAFCGIEAEERGQGEAIARNLMEMSGLTVPILSIVIGEGGSGGALAMAVANEVWMLENAMYSILSPEGFASILWKDSKRASEAAGVMKITASDLLKLGIIEKIIPEKEPASEKNLPLISKHMEREISCFLADYTRMDTEEIVNRRYDRFRRM
ncbi:MAG: acetyl-CoA carboxylase carboxyltransferase subunit beta [Lachnospiraceae bacterium]|nr:acetyl-CoA carboxylase carboxyltransferase subunit beta [Lachnospiraceae bacterium]